MSGQAFSGAGAGWEKPAGGCTRKLCAASRVPLPLSGVLDFLASLHPAPRSQRDPVLAWPRSRSRPLSRSHTLYTAIVSYGSALRLAVARAGPPLPPPRAWGRGGGGSRHCQEARVLVNSGHGLGGSALLQGEGLRGPRGERGSGCWSGQTGEALGGL